MLVDQPLDDGALEVVRREALLLLRVGEEAHLDEHGRHVRADQHPERRLLERAALIGTRSRSDASTACASAADSSM